jgi:hypothetical protein|nr:MAG TPA: hypothetical protein [Caudoviricetes sp.]
MKIIDENGLVVENPDLTAGYLAADTEAVEHPAQDAVEELSHYETVAEYPNGGKDVRKVIDRAAVPAAPAWTEQLPIQRYIRYTAEELARREKEQQEARQQQEALDKLPQTLDTLQKENEMLKQCLLEMSEIVYA